MQLNKKRINLLKRIEKKIESLNNSISTLESILKEPLEEETPKIKPIKLSLYMLDTISNHITTRTIKGNNYNGVFTSVVQYIARNNKTSTHNITKLLRSHDIISTNTYSVRIKETIIRLYIVNTDNLNKAIDELKQ